MNESLREQARKQAVAYANTEPSLLSLLYDLDLMPEQVKPYSKEEWQMMMIVAHWGQRLKPLPN